jgi:hypothetical protein
MSVIIDGTNGITTPDVLSNQDAFGYTTGAGGTVTQLTSKATAVTLNKPSGQITTAADALASGAEISFTLNNTFILPNDFLIVNNSNAGSYTCRTGYPLSGSCVLFIKNNTAGSLSQAITINFAVIKGATS